jgi:hypothetical protein
MAVPGMELEFREGQTQPGSPCRYSYRSASAGSTLAAAEEG